MNHSSSGAPWKTNCLLFVFPFLLLLAAGCVRVDQTLTLMPDGSGTMEWHFGVSQELIDRLSTNSSDQAAIPGFPGAANFPSEEEIRESFKDYGPLGVSLESVSRDEKDGWAYWHLSIHFNSLEGLSKSSLMASRMVSLTLNKDGNYVFQQATGYGPSETGTGPAEQDLERQLMKGFRAVLRLKTPGPILESNASEQGRDEAAWIYDLEKDPDVLQKAGSATMRVVFDGKHLNIPCYATNL
ncbi:MAG: hypothetical protein V2A34_10675 [Lentisphaerota bacterium]